MADEVEVGDELETTPGASPSDRRGMLRLVKAVAFVSVIVIVEIVVAAMLVPTAQETARLAQDLGAATAGQADEDKDEYGTKGSHKRSKRPLREVELGVYNITRYNPATATTLAMDFELYGIVLADDASQFQQYFDNNKARIREQVTLTLHGSDSAELTDAGLGLIKRRILEKTNRALGQPLLKEVLFSRFNFVER